MKSLSDRHNQRQPIPSPKHENMTSDQEFRTDNLEIEGSEDNQEEESKNVSDHKTQKRQKLELRGKFWKTKPPFLDDG